MSPNDRYSGPRIAPSCIFLAVTLLLTVTASGLLTLAIMTDYWEYIDFDVETVVAIAHRTNETRVEMLISSRVVKLTMARTARLGPSRRSGVFAKESNSTRTKRETHVVYLVPMYGGIWAICTSLSDEQRQELAKAGYRYSHCQRYLSSEHVRGGPNDWITRMQNLSISCATVCLILLASSSLLGMFGVFKRQISAVLVTGVKYLLAAIFCIFTLAIMHLKRKTSKDCGLVDPMVPDEYQLAQRTSTGWSLAIGWIGVFFCTVAAVFWYLLSKILRYGPITLTIYVLIEGQPTTTREQEWQRMPG